MLKIKLQKSAVVLAVAACCLAASGCNDIKSSSTDRKLAGNPAAPASSADKPQTVAEIAASEKLSKKRQSERRALQKFSSEISDNNGMIDDHVKAIREFIELGQYDDEVWQSNVKSDATALEDVVKLGRHITLPRECKTVQQAYTKGLDNYAYAAQKLPKEIDLKRESGVRDCLKRLLVGDAWMQKAVVRAKDLDDSLAAQVD